MIAQLPPDLFRAEALQHRLQHKQTQCLLQQSSWIFPLSCLLAVMLVAVVLTLGLIRYKETESARGTLLAQVPALKVVAPGTGIVDSLFVNSGQYVQSGELVANLSIALFDNAGNPMSQSELDVVEAEQQALLADAEFAAKSLQQRQAEVQIQLESYQAQLLLTAETQKTLQERIDISSELLNATETLRASGAISKASFDQQKLAHLNLQSERQVIRSKYLDLERSLNLTRSQYTELQLQWESEQNRIKRANELLTLREQQTRKQDSIAIFAQRDGYVASLNITPGDAVKMGQPLLYLQPERKELLGEVFVPSGVLAKLAPGQQLLMRYDGFNVETYGRYSAVIEEIDRAGIDPREHILPVASSTEPVFRVLVRPEQHYVEGSGIFSLQPGLKFSAEFIVAEMSLIEFIFRPVLRLRGKVA